MSTPTPPPPGGPEPTESTAPSWPTSHPASQARSTPAYLPYGSPYGNPYGGQQGPPSQAMSQWALGLSLAFCVPFAFVVATVLAIIVLVRSRDRREHGRTKAIAALVISGLILLGNIGLLVAGVVEGIRGIDETERAESGQVVDEGDMAPSRLRVGDCFDDALLAGADADETVEAEQVRGIPCSRPHQFEVFHLITMSGEDYPGQAAIDRAAEACFPAFRSYVNKAYAESRLEVSFYFPTDRSWQIFGDRGITCVLYDPAQERLRRSVAGSAR